MINKVRKSLEELNLQPFEKNITVALSGGKDSVALLYALLSLKDEFGLNIKAAHFNHLLRGEDSYKDEAFAVSLAKKLSIEIITEQGDVDSFAKQNKIGIEQAAREMRYAFFEKVNTGVIATAHTASDNAETLLLHILRGSGLDGLCAIPKRRGIFIRPLLNVTTEEILEFLNKNGINYVTDLTNFEDICQRNYIRNKVMPLLKELNPSFVSGVGRLIDSLNDDKKILDSITDEKYSLLKRENGICIKDFENLENSISSRIILRFLQENGFSVSFERVEQIKKVIKEKSSITLDNGKTAAVKNDILQVLNYKEYKFDTKICLNSAESIKTNGKINNLLLKNSIDCDKIVGELKVRTKQSGDKISFAHRKVTKSLKDLFSEDGLDLSLRKTIPVIADDKGVVWVYSYGIDKRVCPNENTKNVFTVKCSKTEFGG